MDNVYERTFARNVEAAAKALLSFEEKHFHPGYKPSCLPEDKKPNSMELMAMFPAAKPYLKSRRRILREALAEAEERAEAELRETLAEINRTECDRPFLTDIAKRTARSRVERYSKELKRIDRFLWEGTEGEITAADIARAREYPIEQLIEVTRRDRFVKCPFHSEKTASLKVFKDNHWWCFGACQEGGDVIDLVMKMDGLKFIEAVRKLSGKV